MVTSIASIVAIAIGSCILGSQLGWQIGFGIAFVAYGIMPEFHS